ncbi:hypothetical protein L6164_023393 [Bauhinia variegata]|uniref:Uncharacterized protein n=1 Tax=Bauhinia variegata TaxID=167791 RepID=A0ACB9MIH5_BAUVA|nr:hypothetical protein L6164_023393 [Bauhinia variegata]
MSSSTATDVSPSSSVILPPPWKYHVYVSFRREDTRRGFVENLCAALKRKGLVTFIDEEQLERERFALSEVANIVGWQTVGWYEWDLIEHIVSTVWKKLFNMCRSISGKSLSDFLVEILAKLVSPEVTNFLAKRLVLDKIKQSLVTLAGMVTGIEKKTFTPKTSEEEWSSHLENILYLLDEAIKHISMGREIIAEAKVNVILKELETMTEDPDLSIRGQTISNEKKTIHFLQSYQESGRKNASMTVIVGGDNSQNTIMACYVYSDETEEASFELRGWVRFANELEALSLTKSILASFNADFHDGDDLQTLVAQLRECLSGRKCLLVINGCDSFQNWEIFEKCFEAAERGSSIILTAQKADITKIADCVVFLYQDVVSVSEAVRADFNSSEMDSSDLPGSIRDQFIWKTLHSTSSHYLGKQPKTILEEDMVPEEVHEVATATSKETDSLIEGLAHLLEPQSPPTGVNSGIKDDNDAKALKAADHQEENAAEIMGVVDDKTEASSGQDIFDFFSSFETTRVSDVKALLLIINLNWLKRREETDSNLNIFCSSSPTLSSHR